MSVVRKPKEERSRAWGLIPGMVLVAEGLISSGKGSGVSAAEWLIAGLGAICLLPLLSLASDYVFGGDGPCRYTLARRLVFVLFSALALPGSFYLAASEISRFSRFAEDVMFLRVSGLAVSGVFLLLSGYLSFCGGKVLKKFTFLSAAFSAAAVVMLLFMSVPHFDGRNLDLALSGGRRVSLMGVITAFARVFAPVTVAVIYLSCERKKAGGASVFRGLLFGCAILATCLACSVLIMGSAFSASCEYPYITAVSTVTAGKLFARMEGFAYMICFSASVIKTAVCLSIIRLILIGFLPPRMSLRKWGAAIHVTASTAVFLLSFFL